MMNVITDLELLQIKNAILKVLHVPGNYTGGVLEMAVVVDCHIPAAELKEHCSQIAGLLKKQQDVFRNVRLNFLQWKSDEEIVKEVIPLSYLQIGKPFEAELSGSEDKTLDELLRQLKLFYARSKVILVLTDGSFRIADQAAVEASLQPFLGRKLLFLQDGKIQKCTIEGLQRR